MPRTEPAVAAIVMPTSPASPPTGGTNEMTASAVTRETRPPAKATAMTRKNAPEVMACIGVMTIPAHLDRRTAARATWMRPLSHGVASRFLLRVNYRELHKDGLLRLLQREAAEHSDVLLIPVTESQRAPHMRVVTLMEWFKAAPSLFPTARWVAKADDDSYINVRMWREQLAEMDAQYVASPTLLGYLVFHNYDTSSYTPRSFAFIFSPPEYWAQSIKGGGYEHRMNNATRRHCRNAPSKCEHCTNASTCSGPFPFPTGWLISASIEFVDAFVASTAVLEDLRLLRKAVAAGWTPHIVFEDIWLGYVTHAHLHRHVRFVNDLSFVERKPVAALTAAGLATSVYHHMAGTMSELHQRVASLSEAQVNEEGKRLGCRQRSRSWMPIRFHKYEEAHNRSYCAFEEVGSGGKTNVGISRTGYDHANNTISSN